MLLKITNAPDEKTAADSINDFLTHSSTRYHRHSFASFLIDQLRTLKDSPWQELKIQDNQCYRKNEVIQTLSEASERVNRAF